MEKKRKLYFSPQYSYADLNLDDPTIAVKAFRDRVKGFYLEPASVLQKQEMAFACGLVCCAAIDLLAHYSGAKNPVAWLRQNVGELAKDPNLAGRFWGRFRDGLVHEGRIKLDQFSFEREKLVEVENRVMTVNPLLLLEAIKEAFETYCSLLERNSAELTGLIRRLRSDFGREIIMPKR